MSTPQKAEPEGDTCGNQNRPVPLLTTPQKIVYVKVGDKGEAFGIHLELACYHSCYLKAAFTGGFSEAIKGEIALDNASPETFGLFVHWMYTQKIPTTICDDLSLQPEQRNANELPSTVHLFELWVLADYLQVPELQNRPLDAIKQRINRVHYLELDALQIPFRTTSRGSMARKFAIDLLCWSSTTAESLHSQRDGTIDEMFIDPLVAERRRRTALNPRNPLEDMSNYYADSSHNKIVCLEDSSRSVQSTRRRKVVLIH